MSDTLTALGNLGTSLGGASGIASAAFGAVGAVAGGLLGSLIPCSFRGVPIQIYDYTITRAPQVKVHMGAYWSLPIVEDLGKAPTIYKISGFIDPNFGFLERPVLEMMVMMPGAGLLSVPSVGIKYVHCLSCSFREDISNIVDVDLEFIEVRSKLGLLGDLISGSLPDSISNAVSDVSTAVTDDLGQAVSTATDAVGGWFK